MTETPTETGPLESLVAQRSAGTTEPTQQQQPGEQVPPWERDGQPFDPERAWNLVTSLRGERETLRAEREQLASEVSQFRNAQLTDAQRLEQERDALRAERDQAASEAIRLRVAVRHGLTEEDFDLLGTGTEEEIDARAQRLVERSRQAPAVPSFDGGARTPTAGADMNALIRRRLSG